MGVSKRITFIQADCDEPLPLSSRSFDVAVSVDVILHLRDRRIFLDRVSQLLKPGASLFFTDAGVMTGAMTDAERELRTLYGYTQFVPEGVNEECIAKAGLLLQNRTDSTELLIATASSRLQARLVLSQEFISFEGQDHFQRQNTYLETIIDLAQRRILSRFTYASSARC
jgi:SAM-dependent methyltransferase